MGSRMRRVRSRHLATESRDPSDRCHAIAYVTTVPRQRFSWQPSLRNQPRDNGCYRNEKKQILRIQRVLGFRGEIYVAN